MQKEIFSDAIFSAALMLLQVRLASGAPLIFPARLWRPPIERYTRRTPLLGCGASARYQHGPLTRASISFLCKDD